MPLRLAPRSLPISACRQACDALTEAAGYLGGKAPWGYRVGNAGAHPRAAGGDARHRSPSAAGDRGEDEGGGRGPELVAIGAHSHPADMMIVTEAEATAIRAAFEQRGELSAAVELRRLFPGVTDAAQARACARTIAGWKPLPAPLGRMPRERPRRRDTTPPA